MKNDNLPAQVDKNDAFSRILRFMTDADIVLSSQEEIILNRWIYCDTQIRLRKFTEDQIISDIVEKYAVSKFTARNDYYQTQSLFEATRKVSKKYLLIHHAERIALQIQKAEDDKNYDILPKLNDSYTKAMAAIPDNLNKETTPPPILFFNVVNGQEIQKPMSIDEARAAAKRKLNKPVPSSAGEDYADFEDMSNGD